MITFSLTRKEEFPLNHRLGKLSCSFWNDAAEIKLSLESEALVIPRRSGTAAPALPPFAG